MLLNHICCCGCCLAAAAVVDDGYAVCVHAQLQMLQLLQSCILMVIFVLALAELAVDWSLAAKCVRLLITQLTVAYPTY